MEKFNTLIKKGVNQGMTDVHISGGHPIVFRRNGKIGFDHKNIWMHKEIDTLVGKLLTIEQIETLKTRLSVDVAKSVAHVRLRINIFLTTRGISIAVRLLPGAVPRFEDLNLHPSLRKFCDLEAGLILICGTTGSGKSTSIAAMVSEINNSRPVHIITLEDPVEYRFVSRMAFIEQRELYTHIPSFERGLIDVLREDPDVIVVGELREPETIRLTLNAAESGHLVIASLHATNSEDALYRICNSFPLEAQIFVRSQLASSLSLVLIQRLDYMERVGFRLPVLSIMAGTQSIKGLIKDDKFSQIENAIQTGKSSDMFTMGQYRKDYLEKRTRFTPPAEIFRPSEEQSDEIVYESPFLKKSMAYHDFSPRKTAPVDKKLKQTTFNHQGEYVIDSMDTMQDVLKELKQSD